MPAQITINQAGKPPGVAGVAREDLDTGVDVTAAAAGGPFLAHAWELIHRPIDVFAGTQATTAPSTPTSSSTILTPINVAGTYLLELRVDSGFGLGASPEDIARVTFYAGPALSTFVDRFPRRRIAFGERLEHNVADAISPGGNPEGWSREWYRWFGLLERLYQARIWASARCTLTGGGAALVRDHNVATVVRVAQGIVDVTFSQALPDTSYAVIPVARGTPGGHCTVDTEAVGGFRLYRSDGAGALVDADFGFAVLLGVVGF